MFGHGPGDIGGRGYPVRRDRAGICTAFIAPRQSPLPHALAWERVLFIVVMIRVSRLDSGVRPF